MTVWTDLTGIDFEVRTVQAAGVPTRALIAGEGPDVVFLHGTSGHLEAFSRNFVPHVSAGLRCHAIDALGHGYTGKPDYPYEIPRYVEHLVGYLDAMDVDQAHLVGESLGGWTAGWLASEQPERVRTLQLVAAGGTKANPEVMARIKATTTRAALDDDISLTRDRLHLLMHDGDRDVSDELVQIRYRIYHQPEFQENLHNLLCLQEMDIRQRNLMGPERLQRITAPTLIVWGSQNPFGDVPEARRMQEHVPGSVLRIFNNCGHWPQHEHAEEYNQLSIDFISSHR